MPSSFRSALFSFARAWFGLFAGLAAAGSFGAEPLDVRLEKIFGEKKEYEAKTFGPAKWADDGASYTTVEKASGAGEGREMVRYEVASGKREVIVTAAQLTPATPGAKPLAIDGYAWSKDGRRLLIFTNAQRVWRQKTRGDYWVWDRPTGRLRQLGGGAPAATLLFGKFSPDGTSVAYVRQNNLHVENVETGAIRPLTTDGSATVINGTADWVNEEELGIRDGFRWSDDGRSIAYWQFDTSGVKDFILLDTTAGLYPEETRFPYPKVGTRNSAVRVGVVPASGGKTRWIALPGDAREHYVPRLSWVKDAATLVVFRLNRLQQQLDIGLADVRSGKVSPFFQDFDAAWVSVREQPLWTHDGRTLLILSERGDWRQLYAVARADPRPRLITPQPFDVIELVGTDAGDEWVYYLASPDHPAQRLLYRSRVDGTRAPERITPAALAGTHAYVLSPDGRHAFHTHSSFGRPPITQLIRLPGHEVVRSLEDNPDLAAKVAKLERPTEFFSVAGGEGVSLDGWMIKPKDFDPRRRYPVIVFIYGEPAGVTVTDAWNGNRVLFHWALADAGYVILSLDNRGTPAPKGREWRKMIYGEVNVRVAQEQATALQHLMRSRPYLDASRVGAWGHSGGGSNTLNLLFRAPETYHVGVASAPVTDQLLYDTIYQERYMGLPTQNPRGFREGSPIHFAEGLRGKLLLIHGAADDNVHFQHSERLINRLVELQKPFDLMVYPNGSHALTEGKGYALHRHRLMARYFQTHLPAGGRP